MSYTPDPYDPSEVEERPRSSHLTRKDLRRLVIAIAIVGLLMTPVFISWRKAAETAICAGNFKGIQTAIGAYMAQYDEHFPPICDQAPNLSPLLEDGKPYTWASLIRPGMEERFTFKCPSAREEEYAHTIDGEGNELLMSYGMYSAWSTAATTMISNPGEAIVIAETSNFGSEDSYNPVPFKDMQGETTTNDGFFIGWNTGNYVDWNAATSSVDMPQHVTRLSFRGTGKGVFGEGSYARHTDGIHVLYVDGHIGMIQPGAAAVRYTDVGGYLTGRWSTRGWPGGVLNEAIKRRSAGKR
jgi:prepilin-type processing-associated H-X9-DG protein